MALIVEDGTGKVDAEAYAAVVDADAYHTAMGNTAWAALTTLEKEVALRIASQYVDVTYDFQGVKLVHNQALEWPRDWYPDNNYSWPIKNLTAAVCELALKSRTQALTVDQEDRAVKKETVGPVAVEYADSAQGGQVRFAIVDKLMAKLLGASGGAFNMRLERA